MARSRRITKFYCVARKKLPQFQISIVQKLCLDQNLILVYYSNIVRNFIEFWSIVFELLTFGFEDVFCSNLAARYYALKSQKRDIFNYVVIFCMGPNNKVHVVWFPHGVKNCIWRSLCGSVLKSDEWAWMILEGYRRAFISLAARDWLVSTELCMRPAWRLSMYIFMIRVYYHAWSSLTNKPDLHWAWGRRLRGSISLEILWLSDKPFCRAKYKTSHHSHPPMIFIAVLNESQDPTLNSTVKKVIFLPFGRDLTSLWPPDVCSPLTLKQQWQSSVRNI
jgi:hypothetical protein